MPSDQILQHVDELRRRVERFGSAQGSADRVGGLTRLHVDVEQDLGVIANEADWSDDEAPRTGCGTIPYEVAKVRPNPWLRLPPRTLVRDRDCFDAGEHGYAPSRGRHFVDVAVACVDDPLRKAVPREDHVVVSSWLSGL